MKTILDHLRRRRRALLWTALGAAAGLAVWRLAGCAAGACPMVGGAPFMLVYGAVLGSLLSQIFRREPEPPEKGGPR